MEQGLEAGGAGVRSPRPTATENFASSSPEFKASQISFSKLVNSGKGKSLTKGLSQAYFWVALLTLLLLFSLVAHNTNLLRKKAPSSSAPAVNLKIDPAELTDETLQASLISSEEQYRLNLVKRWREKKSFMSTTSSMSAAELQADFLVPVYPCSLEGRFGLWGEGGKWICLRHYGAGKPPLVVSVGSKGDTSFETAVHQRLKGFSHTFDFSLTENQKTQMQRYSKFLKFYDQGVSGTGDLPKYAKMFPGSTFVTVPSMLREIGTDYVDIFKIDCEACEHSVVKDMFQHYNRENVPFGQIQMEIHYINNTNTQMELLLALENLGYRMFRAEINGWWVNGYELGFIHERLVKPRFASR